ncbi:MAG TPA: hypothetical protein VHQ99_03520 [Gaiellaceae bacterium]|nr:hypothetical protein [Gaiellaceae bacterium]
MFTYGDYVKEIRPDGRGVRHILYVTSKQGENFEPNWKRPFPRPAFAA